MPPVPMNRIPTIRRDAEDAPDRRRADVACDRARREVARAELASRSSRTARARRSCRPTRIAAVEHADGRRRRARVAYGALHLDAHLDAVRRGESVRDDRRLERDDGTLLVERGAHLVRERMSSLTRSDATGIAPTCRTQRAAASSARSGPPTIQPAARASPAPVESRTSSDRKRLRARSPSKRHPRAPCFRIQAASTSDRPTICSSSSFAKTTSGARLRTARTNVVDAAVADRAPRREVDADPRTVRRAASDGVRSGCAPHRLDHERVARDVQVIAVRSHSGSISSARSSRADPRSAAIERLAVAARRASRSSRCDPRSGRRPRRRSASEPRARRARPRRRRRSSRRSEHEAPSTAAHAATFAACPPGPMRISASVSPLRRQSGAASRTMTSRVRSPSVQTSIATRIVRSDVDGGERRGGLRTFLLGGLVGASAADRGAESPAARSASSWATARSRGLRERAVLPRAPRARAGAETGRS